jgi:hypothetical protein
MGVFHMLAPCLVCGKPFTFHPHKVPSVRVEGVRRPVCWACIERANIKRRVMGMPLIKVLPGAYDPADESELTED